MMSWDALGTMAAALMAFIALNAGTLRWLFERHETADRGITWRRSSARAATFRTRSSAR